MSAHLPAVRARHQKHLLNRLARGLDDDILGLPHVSTSVFTRVQTIPLAGHTIVETNVFTILTLVTDGPTTTQIPSVALPTTSSTPVVTQQSTSSSPALPVTPSSTSPISSSPLPNSSSSIVPPSSVASPSATTSSLTSSSTPSNTASSSTVAKSTLSQSHTLPASVSSPVVSPSDASALGASAATSQSSGLSGGAIAGIIIAVLAVVAVVVVYAVRKIFLRRRQNRRISWGAVTFPKSDFQEPFNEKSAPALAPVPPPVPEKPITPVAISIPAAPPMSYNNPPPPPMSPKHPMASPSPLLQPAAGAPAVPLAHGGTHAYVRCTFVPHLPDELSITTGELVRVINEYDDGWALCQSVRGEQGVVPLECLDRGHPSLQTPGGYMGQGTGDWRMSRRASSLYAAQRAGALY